MCVDSVCNELEEPLEILNESFSELSFAVCRKFCIFKKSGASKQERCIKAIIDNLHEIRKKKPEQKNETLTKNGFEELAASIFKPLEELNAEFTNESETSRTLEPSVEDEIQVEQATNMVTRSKTKDQQDPKDKDQQKDPTEREEW